MFSNFIINAMWCVFLVFCLNALIDFCFGVDIVCGIIEKLSAFINGKSSKKNDGEGA